jgi:hypothetical protein
MVREAIAICKRCEELPECLGYALSNKDATGVLGGTTDKERDAVRKKNRLFATAKAAGAPSWRRPI